MSIEKKQQFQQQLGRLKKQRAQKCYKKYEAERKSKSKNIITIDDICSYRDNPILNMTLSTGHYQGQNIVLKDFLNEEVKNEEKKQQFDLVKEQIRRRKKQKVKSFNSFRLKMENKRRNSSSNSKQHKTKQSTIRQQVKIKKEFERQLQQISKRTISQQSKTLPVISQNYSIDLENSSFLKSSFITFEKIEPKVDKTITNNSEMFKGTYFKNNKNFYNQKISSIITQITKYQKNSIYKVKDEQFRKKIKQVKSLSVDKQLLNPAINELLSKIESSFETQNNQLQKEIIQDEKKLVQGRFKYRISIERQNYHQNIKKLLECKKQYRIQRQREIIKANGIKRSKKESILYKINKLIAEQKQQTQ